MTPFMFARRRMTCIESGRLSGSLFQKGERFQKNRYMIQTVLDKMYGAVAYFVSWFTYNDRVMLAQIHLLCGNKIL